MISRRLRLMTIACCALVAACASTKPRSPQDPFEPVNRGLYHADDLLDRAIGKPIAKAYKKVAPPPIRTGVSNFLENLRTPKVMINDALQGKFKSSANDLGRFLLNSSLGVGGLLDPATDAGLERNDEDLGQTLGKWGVPAGPYIMLPIFGPSSLRDMPTELVDQLANPRHYMNREARYALTGLAVLDDRVSFLALDETLSKTFDPYVFVRDAYLKRREYKVKDGNVPEEEFTDPDLKAPEDTPAKK
jgi:phospholipid-binding lipoprotein MlaA